MYRCIVILSVVYRCIVIVGVVYRCIEIWSVVYRCTVIMVVLYTDVLLSRFVWLFGVGFFGLTQEFFLHLEMSCYYGSYVYRCIVVVSVVSDVL